VCALAWFVLGALARRGIGVGSRAASAPRLQVLERLSLGPRRQLYLVRAEGRVLLLGAGDTGAPALLAELGSERPSEPAPSRVASRSAGFEA
jgi:flagellar biogenesis protein FliO